MSTLLAAPINTSFATPVANTESKINHVISNAVELITVITMWGVVASSVILLGLTWV
jgi:hypothetical protein